MTEHAYTSVRDTMTPSPRCVDGLAPVSQAIDIMREEGLRSLVIEKRHDGDEYGMIVVHDIAEKVISLGRAPQRVSVYEIMTKPAITVDAEMDIKYAIRLLTRFGLSRALVMEKDELIGIVTLRDMVLRYSEDDDG
ncbi:MAG: CBS domain-containing protein [Planctomycetota bacterium]|jgi:signal-transduction protein with cAMP-binding, CBS, and nucleotidyltransferase domain